jgi:TusE/DsrC/DsvC family sulfur relay protein
MLNKAESISRNKPLPISFDEDGFLSEGHPWSMSVSRTIAAMDGIEPLTQEHWAIIYYLREHRLSYGALPPMSQVCRTLGMGRKGVDRLFGGCRKAWRIAGLENPGAEALNYMT